MSMQYRGERSQREFEEWRKRPGNGGDQVNILYQRFLEEQERAQIKDQGRDRKDQERTR